MKTIVIIGQGQLGLQLTHRHLDASDSVTTLSRTAYQALSKHHYPVVADLDHLETAITLPNTIDCLYYFAPPSDTDLHDNRLRSFIALHAHLSIGQVIYISTSGVYGDSNGEWITEQTPVSPVAERSKRRLDAEGQWLNYQQCTHTPLIILRCAAIYSSKTVNFNRIKANTKPVIAKTQAPYTNRIHLQDLAEVCWQAMLNPTQTYEIYNVSDGHPSTTTEHAWLLADLAEIKRNKEIDLSEANQYYSPAYLSYLHESKRLDITKLKQRLNPVFSFENCVDGIKYCLRKNECS